MFTWLANLLVKIPIQGSGCICCEAKKTKLKQMQKEILDAENPTHCSYENCETIAENNNYEKQQTITSYYRYKL